MLPIFDLPIDIVINIIAKAECKIMIEFCKSKGKIFQSWSEYEQWNRSPLFIVEYYDNDNVVQRSTLMYNKKYTIGRCEYQSEVCTRKQFKVTINENGKIFIKNIHKSSPAIVDDRELNFNETIEKSDNIILKFGLSCKIIIKSPERNKYVDYILPGDAPKIFRNMKDYFREKYHLERLGYLPKYLTQSNSSFNVLINELSPFLVDSHRAVDEHFESVTNLYPSDIIRLTIKDRIVKTFRNTFATIIILEDKTVYRKIKKNGIFHEEEKLDNKYNFKFNYYDTILDFRYDPPRFISNKLCSEQLLSLIAKQKTLNGIPFFKHVKIARHALTEEEQFLSVKAQFLEACETLKTYEAFMSQLNKIRDHFSQTQTDYDFDEINGVIYFAYMPTYEYRELSIEFSKELLFYKPEFNPKNYTYIIDGKEHPLKIVKPELVPAEDRVLELNLINGKIDYNIFRTKFHDYPVPIIATYSSSFGPEEIDNSNPVTYLKFKDDDTVFLNKIDNQLIKPIVWTEAHDVDFMLLENGELNEEFFKYVEVPYWNEEMHPYPFAIGHVREIDDGFVKINLTGEELPPSDWDDGSL